MPPKYAIRYREGTDLARRFPEPTAAYDDRGFLEAIRDACANAEHMEIVEVEATEWESSS